MLHLHIILAHDVWLLQAACIAVAPFCASVLVHFVPQKTTSKLCGTSAQRSILNVVERVRNSTIISPRQDLLLRAQIPTTSANRDSIERNKGTADRAQNGLTVGEKRHDCVLDQPPLSTNRGAEVPPLETEICSSGHSDSVLQSPENSDSDCFDGDFDDYF